MAIWQDLVTDYGFSGAYNTVKRFVRKLRGVAATARRRASSSRAPGEEAQVDYGTGPMVRDPQTGKYRRTRLFVMTLGYSRKSVRLLTFRSSSRIWAELHETAFRRLGGCPRLVVLDNLREGVLAADIYDPTLNPLIQGRARALRRDGHAVPRSGSRSQRQSRVRCRSRAEDTAEGTALRKLSKRLRPIWITGNCAGPTRAFTARPNGRSLRCLPKRNRHCCHCRSNRSAITNTANGSCIWMAALKSKPPTTAYRQAGSDGSSTCSGTCFTSASSIRQLINFCASTSVSNAAGIASILKTIPRKTPRSYSRLAGARCSCRISHRFVLPTDPPPPGRGRHPPHPGRALPGEDASASAPTEDACAAALELRIYEYRFVRRYLERRPQLTLKQVDPLIRELIQYRDLINSKTRGATTMNVIELQRALKQLRLGGIAAVLETRLQQAQAEPMAPIDLISCLVSDELTRRGDRLLERRRKAAGFRDLHTLDNFDFSFNKKMNRSLVFDLATANFIARHEDALFLGPPGTGKSHLAQAIGLAAIQQGYRVLYREDTHPAQRDCRSDPRRNTQGTHGTAFHCPAADHR